MTQVKALSVNPHISRLANSASSQLFSHELETGRDEQQTSFAAPSFTPEKAASQLTNAPTQAARQAICRTIATQYGNSYATKVNTIQRETAKTDRQPDELDSLVGLSRY